MIRPDGGRVKPGCTENTSPRPVTRRTCDAGRSAVRHAVMYETLAAGATPEMKATATGGHTMRTIPLATFAAALVCAAIVPGVAQQAPVMPPGIVRTQLVDNDTVLVARLRMAPGAQEDVHTHPFSAIVVQIGEGDVDMRIGSDHARGRRPHGFVEFIPREMPHAAGNAGSAPFDVVTIAIKPDRRPGGAAPASAAPEGITRTPGLDNAEARVTLVGFASGAREPIHSHPFDLLVVQLTAGRVEVRLADDVTVRDQAAGDVLFLPRDVPHAVSNVGGAAFDVLSVGIK